MLHHNSAYTCTLTTPHRTPPLPNTLHSTPRSHAVPMHIYAHRYVYTAISLRACSSAFEPSVQAYPKVQIRSSTLAVKLCCRSVASSTLAVKLCCCIVASSTLAVKLCCCIVASSTLVVKLCCCIVASSTLVVKLCCCIVASSTLAVKLCCCIVASSTLVVKLCCCIVASSKLRCDHCRSSDPFEWVEAGTLAVFFCLAGRQS